MYNLRIDKFLKVSRLIKRRTIANEACSASKVKINSKIAKPGSIVNPGDILEISLGQSLIKVEVLSIFEHVSKNSAKEMYKIIP